MVAENKLLATSGKGSVVMIDPAQWNQFILKLGELGGNLEALQNSMKQFTQEIAAVKKQVTEDVGAVTKTLNDFPCKNGKCAFVDAENERQHHKATRREKVSYLVFGAVLTVVGTLIVNFIVQLFK